MDPQTTLTMTISGTRAGAYSQAMKLGVLLRLTITFQHNVDYSGLSVVLSVQYTTVYNSWLSLSTGIGDIARGCGCEGQFTQLIS